MEERILLRLIRHGKTEGNIRHIYMGTTDLPLCDAGVREIQELYSDGAPLRRAVERVTEGMEFTVFSSPLTRCRQTEEIVFPGIRPVLVEELREMDFGIFEGKSYDELKDMEEYRQFVESEGVINPPGAESRSDVQKRVLAGLKKCRSLLAERGQKRGVVFLHGGTTMSLFSYMNGGGFYDYLIGNGEGYTISVNSDPSSELDIILENDQ